MYRYVSLRIVTSVSVYSYFIPYSTSILFFRAYLISYKIVLCVRTVGLWT